MIANPESSEAYFQPPTHRVTSCLLVKSVAHSQQSFSIVLTPSAGTSTWVVLVSSSTGCLSWSDKPGVHVFDSESQALDTLYQQGPYEIRERAAAVLGYMPLGMAGMLLLATRTRPCVTLPGGHTIYMVLESRWVQIPLQDGMDAPRLSHEEQACVDMLPTFVLNGAHYFCETMDVTRPFPSPSPTEEPSWEFVWNQWLSQPFRSAGLPTACPHLLQGIVESRQLKDLAGQQYTLALFARRSRLHPGMRYIARGLNALASPGNEIECDQVVWTVHAAVGDRSSALHWAAHVWRRGTVPIWWGVELRSGGMGEASIVVAAKGTYKGTKRYFQRLQRRYALLAQPEGRDGQGVQQADGRAVRTGAPEEQGIPLIACINLLRCSMQRKDELLLSEHYAEGLRHVRKASPKASLHMVNFDWHGAIKDLREEGTVEGLWSMLAAILPQCDISRGLLEPHSGKLHPPQGVVQGGDAAEQCIRTPYGPCWTARWQAVQRGLTRFNCADSLDRTNAASYFSAVQVLAEQCKRLGLQVERPPEHLSKVPSASSLGQQSWYGARQPVPKQAPLSDISSIHRRVRDLMLGKPVQSSADDPPPPYPGSSNSTLPPGWEARTDSSTQKTFYVDHNTKATTWVRPAPQAHPPPQLAQPEGAGQEASAQPASSSTSDSPKAPSWGLLTHSVEEVRQLLLPDLLAAQAEIFLVNGDMNSNLYTSSRAMHSAIIGLLQGEGSPMRSAGVGRLANLGVSVQRRWNNVLSDSSRQMVIEIFLGLKLQQHLPSLSLQYPPSPLPGDLESEDDEGEESPGPILQSDDVSADLSTQNTLAGYVPTRSLAPMLALPDVPLPLEQDPLLPEHVQRELPTIKHQDAPSAAAVIAATAGDPLSAGLIVHHSEPSVF